MRTPTSALPGASLTVPEAERAVRPSPQMRRVEIAVLGTDGDVHEFSRLVPSLPAFEDAFAAFARGTILPTDRGPVAVEDLWPGDLVRSAAGALRRLVWRGSTTMVAQGPDLGPDQGLSRLTRIASDALGDGRPMPDLVLGPRARIVHRGPGVRVLTGRDAALMPASDLTDGVNVVRLAPATPVQLYHLAFDRHERLMACGIEVESFHPGPAHAFPLRGEMLDQWLSCFPHRADLAAFGEPDLPRIRLRDLDVFETT